jgi:N-acetylmuramoyl-L-alanine amidase
MRLPSTLILLMFGLPSAAGRGPAEEEYQAARRAYYLLKDDAQRRKFRHQWLNVAHRFEAVAKKYPQGGRAADSLYTAAQLLAELSRISMLDEDLRGAVADYESIVDRYPKDTLADDAALALGRIYLERTGETEKARRIVEHALTALPRGDVRPALVSLRSLLPASPIPRPTGKRVPPRTEASRSAPASDTAQARAPAPAPGKPSAPSEPPAADAGTLLEAIARAAKSPPPATPLPAKPHPQAARPPAAAPAARPERAPSNAPDAGHPRTGSPNIGAADPGGRASVGGDGSGTAEDKASTAVPDGRLRAAVEAGPGDATLAEQLGLKVRRVVIDAGHGGHDTGAIGRRGTREKDVTLAIARKVADLLADRGLEVILTRDEDSFVSLEDRTRIANEAKGDLFISIHCNAAADRKIRGVETFTLNVASDRYSIRLAARENAQSEKSLSDLQFILADLATRAHTEESERLAERVQKSVVASLSREYSSIEDHGTKQALFYVLLGAKMPAILVEASFLSHPEEEKRLGSRAYQADLAAAIASGVQAFLEDRNRMARIE